MILWAEIADIFCRQMVDPRATEFCRAACAQHSPVFLCSNTKFWKREGKRERIIKTTNFRGVTEFSDITFHFVKVCEGFFSHQRTALLILFPWKLVWQTDFWLCVALPPSFSVSPCLPDLTRSILFFWQSVGPNQATLNQMPFQLTVRFPPGAMWSIRRVVLQYIGQIYLGITKQKFFLPNTKMLCHSLSISVRGFIFAIMLLPFHS